MISKLRHAKTHDSWKSENCEDRSRSRFVVVTSPTQTKTDCVLSIKSKTFVLPLLGKMLARVSTFFRQHPMLKGMAVYSVIWPSSSVVQQLITKEDFDWKKSLRFFVFGTFFVAPTLYGWIKLTSHMWPQMSLKNGIAKAVTEQFSYGPAAGVSFFTLMTLMEGKGFADVRTEVSEKFPRTFRGENEVKTVWSFIHSWILFPVGVCYWPFIQVINFSFIKERNRVPFVAMASFIWTIFLAYMQQLDAQDLHEGKTNMSAASVDFSVFDKLRSSLQKEQNQS